MKTIYTVEAYDVSEVMSQIVISVPIERFITERHQFKVISSFFLKTRRKHP